ncbi:histidine kinase [Lichtheimia corymbifera JMRC:FSU:9682]|uniref:histidine kinase n=1 Tax=Lichtheimia corymbifera JMRC:FSU:9682 TaxID=1263082 RepID=A0A068RTP7_9FUNG|nr:histidine kinase [Lichtheimia corymbifera JMRC:FSU:9682]
MQEGYVMQLGADEFKWSHDRITQAAGELVKPDVRCKIHFMIAQHMMKEEDMDVFLVADHLLKCLDLLSSLEDKPSFRELLIDAGNKGRQSGAHDMALSYYKAAIQLSDPEKEWDDDNYPVTLQLYTNTMGLGLLLGDNEVTEKSTEILSKHAKTPLDRKAMYFFKSRYYLSQQKPFEGRDVLLTCLEDLGNEKFTLENAEEAMQEELEKLEKTIENMDIDAIADIGLSDDPYVYATVEILAELSHLLYWTGQKQALCACTGRALNMCLQRGMVPAVSGACGMLTMGYVDVFKNHAAANKMGRLSVVIADRHGGNLQKGQAYMIYVSLVHQFLHHWANSLPIIEAGIQAAYAGGDRYYINYGKLCYSFTYLAVARHLSDALPIAEDAYDEVHNWSTATHQNLMGLSIVRLIKALQGRTYWDTDNVFDGDDGFNDEHFLAESSKPIPIAVIALNWYQSYKMIPLTLYERYDAAVEIGDYCFRTMDSLPCIRHTRVALFYYSIALIGHAREHSESVEKCLKQVAQNQDILYEWVELCRVNYVTLWTLVEAEIAGFQGDDVMKTILLYEEAINHAREGEWCLELSIAHELAGAFYYRQGVHNVAYNMIKKAVDLYTAYGALGKSRHLNAKYADLLSSFNDDRTEARDKSAQTNPIPLVAAPHHQRAQQSWSTSSHDGVDNSPIADELYNSESIPPITAEQTLVTLDIIDMASILKSSQVLASEVKFEALLKNMMQIILENSGADRGAIIVKESKFGIGAYGSQQEEETIVTYEEPEHISKKSVMVSSQIINHTIHTSESIFIPDVEQDARFAVGPWFERAGKKSVICMPIIHKMTTVGCIFLEGAIGIFTQRHIMVLGLLCQQMGISLTNAALFKSVRRVTMANMKMIEMQKQALEEARRSKEAADKATRLREIFLANMSHEIRTPFSGFYGMITLLSETKLDPAQYDLVRTAKSSCEGLLQIIDDLLNFSKLQAGKVSLDLAPVHVEELIADVIDMLIAIAIQKRINVTYTVAEDVPAVVMADANRLRQIIINLLGNAVKFTHHGEISIRCSIDGRKKKTADKGSQVPLLFEVIDTGIGISEEQRKVLFMPFSQVDGSTTRKYGGTGLGLSICLQLVSLMNGDIDVVSETGKGSNFRFSIQVTPVHDQSRRLTEAMQAISKSFIKTRVLVADTHHATVDMMTNFLPNLPLDGVSDYAELQQETPYGIVIVGLLLDHKEGTLSNWENELQKIMKRAKVTVIMHYPLGTSNVQGNIGGVGPILEAASSSVEQEQQRQRQQQPFHISSYGYLDEQQKIVRMGVPLRRNKLLRMLAGFLKEDVPGTPAPKSRPNIFSRIGSSEIKLAIETIPDEHRKAFKKTNILVAEDNPVAQKLLCKQLKRYGFNITCANNGAEAIAAWTKRPVGYFKMALFDHHMPKCDGVEATKTIRRNEKEQNMKKRLPIVALTADIQDSARAICVNAGMDGYLTKPLNEFALLEFVKQYCIDR